MRAFLFDGEIPIPDFHHIHIIMGEEIDRTQVLYVDSDDA